FSEGVILKFSSVELLDQAGTKIATGKIATGAKDEKQLIVPLQAPLKAGTYTVKWTVVAADTHRENGSYSFKVAAGWKQGSLPLASCILRRQWPCSGWRCSRSTAIEAAPANCRRGSIDG